MGAAQIPQRVGMFSRDYTPIVLFFMYVFVFMVCVLGGKTFWTTNNILGITTFLLLLIYFIGSIYGTTNGDASFIKYCDLGTFSFVGSFASRSDVASQFRGVHYLPLNSEFLKDPKKQMPKIIIGTIFIIFLFANLLGLSVCVTKPGSEAMAGELYMLEGGFATLFRTTSTDVGTWLHLPGLLATVLGFTFASGKQLYSIANSGYVPKLFKAKSEITDAPIVSFAVPVLISFLLSLCMIFMEDVAVEIGSIASISSQLTYLNAFICYIIFKTKFSNINKTFESPLGYYGAIYGIGNGVIGIAAVFYMGSYTGIGLIVGYLMIASIVYVFKISKTQKFSEDEKKILFKAYLINANVASKNKLRKNNKVTPQYGSSNNANNSRNKNHSKSSANRGTSISTSQAAETNKPTNPISSVLNEGESKTDSLPAVDSNSNQITQQLPARVESNKVQLSSKNKFSIFSGNSIYPDPSSVANDDGPSKDVENQGRSVELVPPVTQSNSRSFKGEENNLARPPAPASSSIPPLVATQPSFLETMSNKISSSIKKLGGDAVMSPEELAEYSRLVMLQQGVELNDEEEEDKLVAELQQLSNESA